MPVKMFHLGNEFFALTTSQVKKNLFIDRDTHIFFLN